MISRIPVSIVYLAKKERVIGTLDLLVHVVLSVDLSGRRPPLTTTSQPADVHLPYPIVESDSAVRRLG